MKSDGVNYGLNLLRVFLSFCVVLCHFWHTDSKSLDGIWKLFWQMRSSAVPVFMTMTFFFAARRLAEADCAWLRRRLARLWAPFLFWSLVSWSVAYALFQMVGAHSVTLGDLALQLLLGANNKVAGQFWFHSNLIMLTVAFFALFRFVKPNWRPVALGSLVLLCLVFQYTKLNLLCFGNLPTGVRQPFGRLCGTAVYAVLGISLAALKPCLDAAARRTRVFLAVASVFAIWLFVYANPCPRPSFAFVTSQGEKMPTLGSIGLQMVALSAAYFLLFYHLPISGRSALRTFVEWLSRYCMGVYCVHMFLGWILNEHLFARVGVMPNTFGSCILLWLVSWVFCWLVARIPLRFARQIVE